MCYLSSDAVERIRCLVISNSISRPIRPPTTNHPFRGPQLRIENLSLTDIRQSSHHGWLPPGRLLGQTSLNVDLRGESSMHRTLPCDLKQLGTLLLG